MKYFLLLLLPVFAQSQDIPKFSNTILVKGVTFKQVKDTILNYGFFIDQQNEEDGTLITKPLGVCDCKNTDFNQLILYVRVRDSVATFRGKFNNNYNYHAERGGLFSNDKNDFLALEYWKSAMSTYHKIFLKMDRVARSFGGIVSYARL